MQHTPVRWISRLSISQKLAVSFGIIALLLIVGFISTLLYLSRINSYVERHPRITIPGMMAALAMLRNIGDMQTAMHHVWAYDKPSERTASLHAVANVEQATLETLNFYQTTHAARTHPILYGMLQQHGRIDLAGQEDRALAVIVEGVTSLRIQRESAESALATTTQPSMEALYEQTAAKTMDAIASLIEVHRKIDMEMKLEGDRLVDQARWIGMSLLIILGVLIASVYLMMQLYVAAPLKHLADTANRVAHHDYMAEFEVWPVRDEVGTLAESLASMLTSLRERSRALMRKTKELESFSYSIAHDLKGPLREIEGFSSILEQRLAGSGDPEQSRYLGIIRKSSLRLTHMIDALLKYSRLEQQDIPRIQFNIIELIRGLVKDLEFRRSGGHAQITCDLPFAELYGEPISIRQAIENLLDNALKFARHDVPSVIDIGGRQTTTERVIWIRDNGIGFDVSHENKIFGLFERLHSPSEYEGTGVGLAIVRMVVEKHGGRVWVESVKGQGSTFYLAFPDQKE